MKKELSSFIFILVAFLLIGCSTSKSTRFGYSKKTATDTIQNLEQNASSDLIVFKAPNEKTYFAKRVTANLPDEPEEPMPMATAMARTADESGVASATDNDPVMEKFRGGLGGGVREEAKTTYASGSFKKRTLRWLVTKLPDNAAMESFNLGQTSTRCAPEKKNVSVSKAWLYVFKHESNDNDYHLLIGDKKDFRKSSHIFNAEISALPVNFTQDKDQLEKVRRKAVEFFKSRKSCNTIAYVLSIPIEIKGSLFYDYHHKSGTAKCKDVQSVTAWEIHPVFDIVFK